MRVRVALRNIVCGVFFLHLMAGAASAASAGLDTPSGVPTLPIAVEGQTAITLNVDTSGATPPQPTVNFTGPIVEGSSIFNATGRLGIGAAPLYPLDINVTSAPINQPSIRIAGNTANGGVGVILENDITGGNRWSLVSEGGSSAPVGSFGIYDNGLPGERLVILNNGFVGLGTPSPITPLEVEGPTNSSVTLYLETNGTGNIPQYLTFGKNGVPQWDVAGGGLDTNLYIQNIPDQLSNTVDGGNIMSFTPLGFVGIGTTSPAGTLDIENGANTATFCLNGACNTQLSAFNTVSAGTLATYAPGFCNADGSNMITNGAFSASCTSACNRWCGNPASAVPPGHGYRAGTLVEYDVTTNTAGCGCF